MVFAIQFSPLWLLASFLCNGVNNCSFSRFVSSVLLPCRTCEIGPGRLGDVHNSYCDLVTVTCDQASAGKLAKHAQSLGGS